MGADRRNDNPRSTRILRVHNQTLGVLAGDFLPKFMQPTMPLGTPYSIRCNGPAKRLDDRQALALLDGVKILQIISAVLQLAATQQPQLIFPVPVASNNMATRPKCFE